MARTLNIWSSVLKPPAVLLDALGHVGHLLDRPVGIQLQLGVDPADILAADDGNPGNTGTGGEVLPVLPRHVRRAQGTGKDRNAHLDLGVGAVLGLGVNHGKQRIVRSALLAFRQALGAERIAHDVQMRVIDGVILVPPPRR